MKNKLKYILCVLIVFPVYISANDPFAKIPSEETKNYIEDMAISREKYPTKDWWNGSINGDGPPGSGTGGGGAVGVSLAEGTIPLLTVGLLYVSVVAVRKKHKHKIRK